MLLATHVWFPCNKLHRMSMRFQTLKCALSLLRHCRNCIIQGTFDKNDIFAAEKDIVAVFLT